MTQRKSRCAWISYLVTTLVVTGCTDDGVEMGTTSSEVTSHAPPPITIRDFVIYAERSVKLGAYDHIVHGDVGVAIAAPTSFGPQLIVGDHFAGDDLRAPSVSLAHHGTCQRV
jgi:hypothetical protein